MIILICIFEGLEILFFVISDYDFKKDAEWLATEGCPLNIKDDPKHHNKIMVRAGLQTPKKGSLLSSGKKKFVKTFRSLSKEAR